MHPLGQFLVHRSHQAQYEGDWRAAAGWRKLHQRSDAMPLPPEPDRVSRLERVVASLRVLRRLQPRGA